MPTIRKLHEEEVMGLTRKSESTRSKVAQEYDGYLADFSPNDYGEATVSEDESKLTVRNRLKAAAQRRGFALSFMRTTGPLVRFKVEEPAEEQSTSDLADSPKKRGRTKK